MKLKKPPKNPRKIKLKPKALPKEKSIKKPIKTPNAKLTGALSKIEIETKTAAKRRGLAPEKPEENKAKTESPAERKINQKTN